MEAQNQELHEEKQHQQELIMQNIGNVENLKKRNDIRETQLYKAEEEKVSLGAELSESLEKTKQFQQMQYSTDEKLKYQRIYMAKVLSAQELAQVRSHFPILDREVNGKPLTYLDNAATAQKPQVVIDRLTRFYNSDVGKKSLQIDPKIYQQVITFGMSAIEQNYQELEFMIAAEADRIQKLQKDESNN